jgi:hypothetical protein
MAIRHLGQWRDATPDEAKLHKKALRHLFRHGAMSEGVLAGRCQTDSRSEAWGKALAKLTAWGMVEVPAETRKGTKVVALSATGREFAMELCCEEQVAQFDAAEAGRLAKVAAEREAL